MADRVGVGREIRNAVVTALSPHDRVVLAVSGGRDSMVMLDAASTVGGIIVATFDHGTSPTAARAADLVERRCADLGTPCVRGRARARVSTEAAWREQRWRFLRAVAKDGAAPIATAHTLDDQIETVFIRILRGAGARGLAGLYARADILRPLLTFPRADVARYAEERGLEYAEDPSNRSRAHLRNRVRMDLLPAIVAHRPSFPGELVSLALRAAEWRDSVTCIVDALGVEQHSDGSLYVARRTLQSYDARELAILWPEIAARARVTMDRRGTRRLAAFTIDGATGGSIQLSGGTEVVRSREHFVLRRRSA